jgi:hypothetical protein
MGRNELEKRRCERKIKRRRDKGKINVTKVK